MNSKLFSLLKNFGPKGHALVMLYFVSLDKPEFIQFAEQISTKTSLDQCYAMGWVVSANYTFPVKQVDEMMSFLRDCANRDNWEVSVWLKNQMQDFN